MTYKVEESLDHFEAWSGGRDTISIIKDYDEKHNTNYYDQLCDLADDLFNEDNLVTDTDINDWLWFDVPDDEAFSEIFDEQ